MGWLSRLKSLLWRGRDPSGSPSVTDDRDSLNYFKLGTQYYVAARGATFAGCLPVAGNLFHHAIEMYLKGDLCQILPRRELKRLGHRLKRLWKTYKGKHPVANWGPYDSLINELEKFERIRYPDALTDRGMLAAISVGGPNPLASIPSGGANATPRYSLVVTEIDQLVRAICDTTSRNPDFLFGSLSSEGRATIHRDNSAFPTVP